MLRATPLALVLAITTPSQDSPIDWLTDFDIAREQAKRQHAPMFVVFRCER